MPWFRVEDNFHGHPKITRIGNAPIGLWLRCGTYSSAYLLNGKVPTDTARLYGRPKEIDALVDAGLWTPNGDGWTMHDFLDYNPSAEQVQADRAAARDRMTKRRRTKRGTFE
jgi:hypothetical protein